MLRKGSLLSNAQFLDELFVTVGILTFQVIQEAAPGSDHHEEAAPRMVVLSVGLEMFRQVLNSLAEQGDLDLWGSGVARMGLV